MGGGTFQVLRLLLPKEAVCFGFALTDEAQVVRELASSSSRAAWVLRDAQCTFILFGHTFGLALFQVYVASSTVVRSRSVPRDR